MGPTLASVTVAASAPALQLAALTPPLGPMVRVLVRGIGGSAGNTSATLSIDLVVRDN